MKLSLFKDDKSTHKDEIILGIISILCLTIGILLVVFKPAFWIIDGGLSAGFGIAVIMLAVMYIPCVIYRFLH